MIKDMRLSLIYNSRGEQTVKVSVITERGIFSSCAPSGKSVGKYEAKTLEPSIISGFFKKFKLNLIGLREEDFEIIDKMLEQFGGHSLAKIGANLAIAISQAVCKAAALGNVYSLLNHYPRYFPFPLGNVFGGGAHGGGTDIQEFLVMPVKAKTISEAVETNIKIWKRANELLRMKGFVTGKNDEGAIVSRLDDIKTLDVLSYVTEQFDARIGLDFAANNLYKRGYYNYLKLGKKFSSLEHIDFVLELIKTYNIAYVEDPFKETDYESFSELRKKAKCIVCGDDLYATDYKRLNLGIKKAATNAIIIKPNQVGTVSKTLRAIELAKGSGILHVISHRSGETCDSFISDLAVGTEAKIIKCGIMGSERAVKHNRLIEIWENVLERRKPKMADLSLII